MQFVDQIKMRLILQLFKGIPSFLQKLLKYFKDTAKTALGVLTDILTLKLNDSELVKLSFGSFL